MNSFYTIGICCMESSSACIFKNGQLIAAVEEERLSRIKNDSNFPILSIKECLSIANIGIEKVDIISVYWQPWRVFTRLHQTLLKMFKSLDAFKSILVRANKIFLRKNKTHIYEKNKISGTWTNIFFIKKLISKNIGSFNGKIHFHDHHQTHRDYAENIKNWQNYISLSFDGGGEEYSTIISVNQNKKIEIIKKIKWPNSLGHFYSFFTGFLGFKMLEGEYKMMGLAPLGKPIYKDIILNKILTLHQNGDYKLNTKSCDYHSALRGIYSKDIQNLFGSPRKSDEIINSNHEDLASSVQAVFEEALLNLLFWAKKSYPEVENLFISGGCALNVSANGVILKKSLFKNISVPPAPHDAGCSIGAVISSFKKLNLENNIDHKSIKNPYLGRKYKDEEVINEFKKLNIQIPKYYEENELINITCDSLKKQKIVAWFQGGSEFGPRALGNRSFLADPRKANIREIINSKIKKREYFRPFAPSCLSEYGKDFFDINQDSPYMNIVAEVKHEKKGLIPGVIHEDGTSRVHLVNKEHNPLYYKLLTEFNKKTGVPILLNTSFNIQEPIVYNPKDAISTFLNSGVDLLVINNFILENKK